MYATEDEARAAHARQEANYATVRDRLRRFLSVNRDYLALDAPTAAELRTQTDKLTRQVNALIRLTLADLDDIGGTQ